MFDAGMVYEAYAHLSLFKFMFNIDHRKPAN